MGQVTLSTTVQVVIPAARLRRKGVILDNQDSSIQTAVVERDGQTTSDGARVGPGQRRFYNSTDDGESRLQRAFKMVAASGTPVIAFEEIFDE